MKPFFSKIYTLIPYILAVVLIGRIVLLSSPISKLFVSSYDFKQLESVYNSSQYVQEVNPGIIPDETVYSYAAGYYLYGGNPIMVEPAHPPLGKYIIGLSIYFFNNTVFAVYLFFYLCILALFLLTQEVVKNRIVALCVVIAYTFEPTFTNQIVYMPILDIFQLYFILLCFYFFIRFVKQKARRQRILYLSAFSLCVAMVASIKFFITAVIILYAVLIYLFFHKRWKDSVIVLGAVGVAVYIVLTLSYLVTLREGFTFIKVLQIQKWILDYHSSKLTSIFSVWPLIYFNRWQTWWGTKEIIKDGQWWIGWPIVFTLSFMSTFHLIAKKVKQSSLSLITIWFVVFCAFMSVSQATSRYLIPILPFCYILSGNVLYALYQQISELRVKPQ